MANSIAFVEKYVTDKIDEVYFLESLTERFFKNNALVASWTDGKTCKVFNLATSGYQDYKRGGYGNTNADGAVNTNLESFTLSQERFAAIPVDKLDTIDDMGVVLGHLATQFARTKHTPELDAYRLSKLAGYTSTEYGNRVSESISANTIISKFNAAFKYLTNHKVPAKDQVIFVSPTVMELIRNTTELAHKLNVETTTADYKGKSITFDIEKYAGREIVEVPEDMFYTDLVTGNGYYPAASSKVINFIVCDAKAPFAVTHLNWTKVYDSDNVDLGFVGYKYEQLCYHDLFVPANKECGVYCSVSTTDADDVASVVDIKAKASTNSGKTILTKVATNPAGILFDKICLSTASSRPAIGSSTTGLTELTLGTDFTPDASHNIFVASYGGKAVAVSKDFTNNLPKGA